MSPWWQHLYDDNLAELLLEPENNKEAEATLLFLQRQLGLQAGETILDQCCGTGRLAVVLARNHRVIGVDLMPDYIAQAEAKLQRAQLGAEFICHDALVFQTAEPVDMAINWWTSFGYSGEDAVNRKMIQCAYQSLKRGGRYALDFMNVPGLYRYFQQDVMTQKTPRGASSPCCGAPR